MRSLENVPPMVSESMFYEPYFALSAANITYRQENYYEQMIGQNICSLDIDAMNERFERAIPWWNVLGQVATPNFAAQWRKGGDRMLSVELTHLVVQAKALAAKQGDWPETLPNLTSQACPELKGLQTFISIIASYLTISKIYLTVATTC